ncbi:hypothetical protein BJ875DRAFT_533996 [Amylocarpus encephaloides]|uniref:NACHT domain-containing protein n=1 Tax=Amylocarpus encephaloides TaxID=45428 RepID=A0A9P8C6W1_9HELO|nr:hypothetical protein BJ875DRAFT_533996 [Amylocarpus encephaloides]
MPDEVTFKDLQNGTGTKKGGYQKIRFCAEQSKRDSLQYFWVDTCCIDKSNSAELAEAINSMFRWYRMSTKCYVYLPDISRNAVNTDELAWELAFRKCKWFTRGWTLQELIAPTSVEFFCGESKRIGNKSSLEQQIHEITGIPKSALQGAHLSQFSNKERFSWIQPRQTKVEEDKAYSLLGIFDVHMPLRYGEGMSNTFKRLEEEIDKFNSCLRDLRLSDPRDDKTRIEDTKGGLLEGSYHWVLKTSDFQQWRNNPQTWLLWIKGDPGKGKTMLLCGIINELKKSMPKSTLLSFFFCQATDYRINNATAVLRGLIYLLINEQPSLLSHVALCEIFTNILQDPNLNSTCLIVDALNECAISSIFPRTKWIVSSRNWPSIEKDLDRATQKISMCLELNEKSVSAAVTTYIKSKRYLSSNVNGTFLWVALVCQELAFISEWEVEEMLSTFPPGLDIFYMRMIEQISTSRTAKRCKSILAVVSLPSFLDMPPQSSRLCGSFLTLRERTISFVHQSAKDFLIKEASNDIFPSGIDDINHAIFSRSLQVILRAPGISIDQVKQPDPDPLAAIRYSCLYWVDHLLDYQTRDNIIPDLKDSGSVYNFLRQYFLSLSSGIAMTAKLEVWLQAGGSPDLLAFIYDAKRFARYWHSVVEKTPLQLYCSALVFAPDKSIVRKRFEKCIPPWIRSWPKMEAHWGAALQILEGHSHSVKTVAFSLDGEQLASGSDDQTVRIWDATRATLQILEGHASSVTSVAFSPNGKQLASGSSDETVRVWDAGTGATLQILQGHSNSVWIIAFSPNGKHLASGSKDHTVRIWDIVTGATLQTLDHLTDVYAVAFSADGKRLASDSRDKTVRIRDTVTGAVLQTLDDNTVVTMLSYSSYGSMVTDRGRLDAVLLCDYALHSSDSPLILSRPVASQSKIFVQGGWIVHGEDRMLWLPPDYRPSCSAVHEDVVGLGHRSGCVSIFNFSFTSL